MSSKWVRFFGLFVAAFLTATTHRAFAQGPEREHAPEAAPAQGVAVVASGDSREAAFLLARALYASTLRPRQLDEGKARALAGDPPAETASAEVRDLAELRKSMGGDDVASRRLLASVAGQLHVQALLVVTTLSPPNAGAPEAPPSETHARLFLADTQEYDAARYDPDPGSPATPWRSVVASLERRFGTARPEAPGPRPAPAMAVAPAKVPSRETPESRPFYTSPWLWGALGAAVLVGGAFFLASRDTSGDPIHLQMRVPR